MKCETCDGLDTLMILTETLFVQGRQNEMKWKYAIAA